MENSVPSTIKELLLSLCSQVEETYQTGNDDTCFLETNREEIISKMLNVQPQDKITFHDMPVHVFKCHKQINSDICGFHCLFNILQFCKYFFSGSTTLEKEIENGASFWRCYQNLLNYLLRHFPNKAELKALENLGPLERVHMDYILEHYPELQKYIKEFQEKCCISVFIQPYLFGFGIMQNSEEELSKIQDFALSLQSRKEDENILMFFPLGITIHWSLLIVLISKGKQKYYYLDSKNVRLDYILQDNFTEAIRQLDEDDKFHGEKTQTEVEKRRQLNWMKDLKKTIEILINVINGKKTLLEYSLEGTIDETLTDFDNFVQITDDNLMNSEIVKRIYQWFDDEYRPQVISNSILKQLQISKKVGQSHFARLKNFEKVCEQFIQQVQKNNLAQSLNFESKLFQDILDFADALKGILLETKVD